MYDSFTILNYFYLFLAIDIKRREIFRIDNLLKGKYVFIC